MADQFAIAHRTSADALFIGAQLTYTKCYNSSTWAMACGIHEELANALMTTKSRVPCCPLRLVSYEFKTVVRECGNLISATVSNRQCEGPVSVRKPCPMLTTDHWELSKSCKDCLNTNSSESRSPLHVAAKCGGVHLPRIPTGLAEMRPFSLRSADK